MYVRNASPVWRCELNHSNDMLRGSCRDCGETRECQKCGSRPARLFPNGMWCDSCGVVAPTSFVATRPNRPSGLKVDPNPVFVAQRPAQRAEVPSGLRSLWDWCIGAGFAWKVTYSITVDRVEFVGLRVKVDQVPYKKRRVTVMYAQGRFDHALVSDAGVVVLRDAKRALGMIVADPKPRVKSVAKSAKRQTRVDTLR